MLRPAFLLGLLVATAAQAQTTQDRQRCAIRLSGTLLGTTPSAALLASTNPQSMVDAMLAQPEFIEKFSRWINADFNRDPGMTAPEDASYYLSKYVLSNGKPWSEMFVGQYDINADATAGAVVVSNPNGLGYFRTKAWMMRYAGNELDGYRIVSAYRMMNNVLGLHLVAAVNTNGVNATGRQAPACAGCHYNNIYGLDYVAKILSRRVGTGTTMTFAPPSEGPQVLLGGIQVNDDKSFVTAMVGSLDFRYRACRIAVQYLYGRSELKCEGPVFDTCMSAFSASGTMQAAVAAIAKDPSFCQ
jgi:hypothetical protein